MKIQCALISLRSFPVPRRETIRRRFHSSFVCKNIHRFVLRGVVISFSFFEKPFSQNVGKQARATVKQWNLVKHPRWRIGFIATFKPAFWHLSWQSMGPQLGCWWHTDTLTVVTTSCSWAQASSGFHLGRSWCWSGVLRRFGECTKKELEE